MKAYIKKDSDRSDALWLIIEYENKSESVHPIFADEVSLIYKACEKWLNVKRKE